MDRSCFHSCNGADIALIGLELAEDAASTAGLLDDKIDMKNVDRISGNTGSCSVWTDSV